MSNSNHPLNSSNSLHYTKLKALRVANFPYKCVCTQALSQRWRAPILDAARPQAGTTGPQSHAVSPDISHGMAASTLCRKHVLGVFHEDSATYLTQVCFKEIPACLLFKITFSSLTNSKRNYTVKRSRHREFDESSWNFDSDGSCPMGP